MKVEHPSDWDIKELGEFAKATGGSRFPPDAQGESEGEFPFYKVSDMNLPGNERFMRNSNNWITESTRRRIKAKTHPPGAIVFPKIGAAVATNKKRLLTCESIVDNNVMAVAINDSSACIPEYLRFWFETIHLSRLSNSGALPSIPAHRVHTQKVPLPPLPEQKKIAHILSTVQRAIEAQERIIQTTTELKKALMQKLFTEGLRNEPQKQTEFGPVPESWEVVQLGDCAVVQTGIAKGRKARAEEAVEVPYLRVANVQDGYLDLSEMKSIIIRRSEYQRFALHDGDVVLTEGGDFDKLGRGFIWHGQIDNCVHQNHVFAVRPDTSRISSEFFAYQSQSPYGKSYFLSVAHKTTNLACINSTKLKAFPVLLPPQDQQNDIVDACSSIDGKIRNATNKKIQLQGLFRALLYELMTAKTRVPNEVDLGPQPGRK